MYQEIGKRPNIYQLYRDKLLAEGVISDNEVKELWSQKLSKINQAYVESQKETFDIKKWRVPSYYKVVDFTNLGEINRTGLDMDTLKSIGESITKLPETFTPHSSIKKIYDARVNAIKTGEGIDFALA
jgi:2-oxoglutarate dehydrogenase E1 component